MKSDLEKKIPYFSAYPLKALNLPEEEYNSALQLRNAATPAKTVLRVRVLPMTNPYREKDFVQDKHESIE
jgi:hypothetical protein